MGLFSSLKKFARRIAKNNNRSLGTLFGCIAGCILGAILVHKHSASLAVLGNPSTHQALQVFAVILAAGTGGNLMSYIGATIDILTNEKTIFDLLGYLWRICCSCCKKKAPPKAQASETTAPEVLKEKPDEQKGKHLHYPYITSFQPENGSGSDDHMKDEVTSLREELVYIERVMKEFVEKQSHLQARIQEMENSTKNSTKQTLPGSETLTIVSK